MQQIVKEVLSEIYHCLRDNGKIPKDLLKRIKKCFKKEKEKEKSFCALELEKSIDEPKEHELKTKKPLSK
uniref:Uncharacterized protein n=1 Tax=Heterorhabditis bacteriophora TaxID=37862 RepID=A0A1I7WYS3_HETBA